MEGRNKVANMGKNKGISMETLEKICDALQCEIMEVIELMEDPQKENVYDLTNTVCYI